MSRYYGLIIPRSYNDYYNKSQPQELRDGIIQNTLSALDTTKAQPVNSSAVESLDKLKYATLRSATNIDTILDGYNGKIYFQLCDTNSSGTKPSGINSGIIQTLSWDNGNYATQIFTEIDTAHRVFIRYNNNGTWTNWEKFASQKSFVYSVTTTERTVNTNITEAGVYLISVAQNFDTGINGVSTATYIVTCFNGVNAQMIQHYEGAPSWVIANQLTIGYDNGITFKLKGFYGNTNFNINIQKL